MQLVHRLRGRMAEYQDELVRQSRVLALEAPSARAKVALVGWFRKKRPLVGQSRFI